MGHGWVSFGTDHSGLASDVPTHVRETLESKQRDDYKRDSDDYCSVFHRLRVLDKENLQRKA